ncbi:16S rRNA (adenine(1518)-N(6)/adenine(1519)-N(6))-dimethyltransferase RsmA [Wenyingzhuangia sp. 2_MG-2023]|uniref:16S rRNA (adenine(1518)-N(6)/adenine(1519)-N(6))- dimethyltransferase RsmA n=1 Tax=Wenyingzhuangia sp. 2_MG-2023 TaxID=3062639 RepID=UPI0026E14876|nr:16S rRNA (adenine(1518)-N(6)/adenine(1519)-N(6))-dimethyltransferase RsmA [Wenyingzhuangia sp. 2_MG-2023]MDO6736239.1 16S rRNA (adenine(1518)-N(6)/adenine(1519)-N(6))-dimethyltransferase RsmA [Wenyingzhuangia sp. 2_MG-2023]
MSVRAKKHLGQHFLTDESIAEKIADILSEKGYNQVLEIGPGMGMMTKYLLKKKYTTHVIEIDDESVEYLQAHYLHLGPRIYGKDFLKMDLSEIFKGEQFAIIGNFPYNISSQIVFKTIENRASIPEFGGMFQKEVAQRICAPPGSKTYGIISVLTQAYYNTEYLFTVPPTVFNPPPRVESGVLVMKRKESLTLSVPDRLFKHVVKTAFGQRRKTLRNSLKSLNLSDDLRTNPIFDKRPEQISVEGFTELTALIEQDGISNQ